MNPLDHLFISHVMDTASDLHLCARSVHARINGTVVLLPDVVFESDEAFMESLSTSVIRDEKRRHLVFTQKKTQDFSLTVGHQSKTYRCRANAFHCHDGLHCTLRILPATPLPVQNSGYPTAVIKRILELEAGLVLVAGPTGSGKSTTLASLLTLIAFHKQRHILTIEDPVEYLLPTTGKAVISQIDVGDLECSFADALRSAMRQDPDVILIGEMRDRETIQTALLAAETGHLVFSTVHANSTTETVNRILTHFNGLEQDAARETLATALQVVIMQKLLPSTRGSRVCCFEILTSNSAIQGSIRNKSVQQIPDILRTNKESGMNTWQQCLDRLKETGQVDSATYSLHSEARTHI